MRSSSGESRVTICVAVGAGASLAIVAVSQPVLALGAVVGLAVVALSFVRPLVGITLWLGVVFFVPEWTRVELGPFPLRAYQVVGIAALTGSLMSPRVRLRQGLGAVDAAFAGGVAVVVLFAASGSTPLFTLVNVVAAMAMPYAMGRISPDGIQARMCVMGAVLAAWGILEIITNIHVFTTWMPSLSHHWGEIQTRAGLTRAEASMGHAISFGATCALCLPYVARLRRFQRLTGVLLVVGVMVSLSRGPLLALVATAGLAAVFLVPRRRKTTAVLGLMLMTGLVALVLNFVYTGSDATDVQLSGDQRLVQLRSIFESVNWLQPVPFQVSEGGALIANSVDTIDSTPLRFGVNYGWVGAALLLAPIGYALFSVIRARESTPSALAVSGQIPVLLVTTLITQWQVLILFVAGLAVTEVRERAAWPTRQDEALQDRHANAR